MNREPILSQLDRDLACAVALGFIEMPRVVATLDTVSLLDERMQPIGKESGWLEGDDPLDVATREFLRAHRDMNMSTVRKPGQSGWAQSAAIKIREEALKKKAQARQTALQYLEQRGVLALARRKGMRVIEPS